MTLHQLWLLASSVDLVRLLLCCTKIFKINDLIFPVYHRQCARQKDKYERVQRALRTEAYQNQLFEGFVHRSDDSSLVFSKLDFVAHIRNRHESYYRAPLLRLLGDTSIDPETAQTVAELVLLRLEQRGVISPVPGKTLSPQYRFELQGC